MHIITDETQDLFRWIRDEVEFEREVSRGSRGMAVRRVQEWLNLHGIGLVVDGAFGPISERSVRRFQAHAGLNDTGVVEAETFNALVRPMMDVLQQRLVMSTGMNEAITAYAEAHLAVHPREVGGQNKGPWVRLYMLGNEGVPFPWCAGFVTFLMNQAAQSLEVDTPIRGSGSCDSLAAQARETNRFLNENEAHPTDLPSGTLFLVRRTDTDWTHTGLVTTAFEDGFDTIEGNTNDEGVREGFEVCTRTRAYSSKDFILMG